MTTICTITPNPTIDVNTAVDRVEPDRKLRCDDPQREPGGGGLNVARVIARLGGRSLALWAKGGTTGDLLHQLLDAEQLDHLPVSVAGMVRESFSVLERASGRQFRFNTPGPTLAPDGLAAFFDQLQYIDPRPSWIVGSGSLPPGVDAGFFAELAKASAKLGAKCIIDTSGEPLQRALQGGGATVIKPNLRELSSLVGRELQDDADIAAAARELVEQGGTEIVFASLGAGGALLVTRDRCERIVAPMVRVRSRIGAGDSTVAGLAVALARSEQIDRAAHFAVATGAAAVMTPGTELARRDDVHRLFGAMTAGRQ